MPVVTLFVPCIVTPLFLIRDNGMFFDIMFYIIAYLLGSLSSAIIIAKLCKLPDPRQHGSGNPGATNVLRTAGKFAGIAVLIFDFLKGMLPVLLAKFCGTTPVALGFVAMAAVLGHMWPIFFRFKGGKGIATGIGGVFGLSWPLALIALLVWLVVVAVTRYVSLASIIAAISVLFFNFWLGQRGYFLALFIVVILIIWRHKANIKRLIQGSESRLGQKK